MGNEDKGLHINKQPVKEEPHPLELLKKRMENGEDFSYLQLDKPDTRLPGYSTEEAMNDFGQSKYDKSLTQQYFKNYGDSNLGYQEQRGQEQSSIAKLGSGLGNAVVQTGLDIVKDASYLLDFENYFDFKKSSEEGFHNWLGDAMQAAEDKLKLPVYRTRESQGFSPLSAGWWGDNIPSIASTLAMIIPAEGAVKGLSMLGKTMGGDKVIKAIETASGITGLADKAKGVGAAIVSRQMESLMEGGQTYQDTYKTAVDAGKTEAEARVIAGQAAADNYKLNWAAIIQDIPEYMILHKTFKESNALFSKAAAKEAIKTAGLEGSEEAYQFITDKESKRSALINGQVLEDDKTSLGDRLLKYSKDSDLWTSAFFGAIGGAGFGAIGVHKDNQSQQQFDAMLEMHKSILKGDPETYYRAQDNMLNATLADAAVAGNLENFKEGVKYMMSNPERIKDDQRLEVTKRLNEAVKQAEYAERVSKEVMNDNSLTPELKKLTFNSKLNQRSVEGRLFDINNKVFSFRAKDSAVLGLTPDVQAYKESKLAVEGMKTIPVLQAKATELEKINSSVAEDIVKAYPTRFKSVEELNKSIISSHDTELTNLLTNKAVEENNLAEAKDTLHILSTEEGRAVLKDKIEKSKKRDNTHKEIVDSIDKATSEEELDDLLDRADKNKTSSPELIDKIAKKRDSLKPIETEPVSLTPVSDITSSTVKDAVPDIVDETNVQNTNPIEDDSKRPSSVKKTNNGPDDSLKEAETRAYRYHEKMVLDGHRLLVVTRNNNAELFNKILAEDPTGKQFEEDFFNGKADKSHYLGENVTIGKHYNGIYTVLVDKAGKIILADQNGNNDPNGKMIFHTLETANRVESDEINVTDKESAIDEISNIRGRLLKSTTPVYLPVVSKSRGIAVLLPKVDGKRQSISVIESFGPIDTLELELPTQQADSDRKGTAFLSKNRQGHRQVAFTGKLYVYDKNNTAFDLIPRNVNEKEADMIINLVYQGMGLIERTASKPVTEIEKIISALIPKAGPNDYTFGFKGSDLYIGKDIVYTAEDFKEKPEEVHDTMKSFLMNVKHVNANTNKKNGYQFNDKFVGPTINDKEPGKTYGSYKEYLLSGETPMFGTDLSPKSGVQYRNIYLIYDDNIQTNIIENGTSWTDSNGDIIDIKGAVPLNDLLNEGSENTPKKRDFYKSTEGDNDESLDRTVEAVQTKRVPLSEFERNWFKDRFPNIPVELIRDLIENRSYGRFLSSGKVLLSDKAVGGTLYHEAFHTVTQLYLKQDEIDALYSETRERLELEDASDRDVEEILAEDFAKYKEDGKILKEAPKHNSIFRRILDLLKRLIGLPASSIEEIYRRLDKGYYTNRKIVGLRQFSSLDSTIPGLTVTETKELYSGMDAMFFDIAFKDNKTPDQALSKTPKVLEFIYKRLVKREQEVIADGDQKLIKIYDTILSNWPSVMEGWIEKMASLNVTIETENELGDKVAVELTPDEDVELAEKNGRDVNFQASNEISTKSTMFKASKMLIRSLKQKNSNGTDKLNSLGLPQVVEFGATYNALLKQTVGLAEYSEIYNKIRELSVSRPEYIDLLTRIKAPSDNLTFEQWLFQMQFRQDFSKNFATSYITAMEDDGRILQVDTTKQNALEKVEERWKSNLKLKAKNTEEGKLVITPVKTSNDVTYLKSIGMELSQETIPHAENNKEFSDSVTEIRKYITDNKGDVTKLYERGKDAVIRGRIDKILALEAEYDNSNIELSVMSTTNKTIYPISQNNGLSIIKNLINNSDSLNDLYNKLPNLNTVTVEGSVWLDTMFNKDNGKRRPEYKLHLNLADGLKTGTSIRETVANSTKNLGTADKFVQEIDHLLKTGNSSVLRTADKATEHITGIGTLIVSIEDLATDKDAPNITGLNNERLKSIFRGYFKSELRGIAMFELYDLGKDYDEYSKNGGSWTVFQDFPKTKKIKDKVANVLENMKPAVKAGMSTEEVDRVLDELASSLYADIDVSVAEFFKQYAKELKNKLEEYKLIDKVETGAVEGLQVLEDTTNELKPRAFSKELTDKYTTEQLINAVVVNDFINSVEQTKLFFGNMAFYKALFKRTSSLAGTKDTCATDDYVNSLLNRDNKRKDNKTADGKINVAIFEDSTQSKQGLGEYKKALMNAGFKESEADNLLKAYRKMDEGDAQGWITLDELREFCIRMGHWSPAIEKLWDKAQSYKREDQSTHLTRGEFKELFFVVKKAQYAGPVVNNKLFVPAFHKFSLMPLIPQLVEGRNMSKVLDNMTRQKVGYALFKSGSKVGTPLINGKANGFYTEVNQGEVNTGDYNIQVVDYRFLGQQTKTSEPHDKVTFGTQFRKLIFTGAFEGGNEKIPGSRELFDEYTKIIKGQVEAAKAKLVEDLGLDPNDDYRVKDVSNLVKLLRKEAKERSLADNIVESIQSSINEAEEIILKYPLDAFVNKSKIDAMMMSLINSRLIRQKVNGDAYIQGASTGFETIGVRKAGTNSALKFYEQVKDKDGNITSTSKAEVMIPMSKNFYPLLDKYGSIEALNEVIRNKTIDERLITLIAYRIPTQGLNSIDHLVVKEFLVEQSGQLIILPTEIVAKSGGDYDIDKMNVFRPDIDKEGNYKETDHNRIIEISSSMLSNPANFTALITPNSTGILTDMVEDYEYLTYKTKGGKESKDDYLNKKEKKSVNYTRQLMMTEKVEEQHTKLMLAKDMIGIAAVNNVFIPLAQNVKAVINSYKHSVKINFPHHLISEGEESHIDLSKDKDALGLNNIQEVNSQVINATVDAANSPGLLAALGMTMDTLSVYLYLNNVGVPFEFTFYMMKQPIIQRYIKESSINNSGFLAAQGRKEKTAELRERILDEFATKITAPIADREYTDTEELKKFSVYDPSKGLTPELDNEFYNTQVQMFTDFLKYKEQATMLSDAIRSINSDTAGLPGNLEGVHLKVDANKEVVKQDFVKGLDKIMNDTFIGAFNQTDFAIKAYSQFYATQDPRITTAMTKLAKFIGPFRGEDKARLATMITNDLINYVVQNYGYEDIATVHNRLFKGENSVAKRIAKIKASPAAQDVRLADNLVIKELQPIINNEKTESKIDNLRLYTKRFDAYTSDQLTEAFKELKESDPSLYKDIVDLGIIQSGLANSAITYVGIIPSEYYGDLFNKAFEKFRNENGIAEIEKFMMLFIKNNTKDGIIYRRNKKLGLTPIGEGMYGKNYDKNLIKDTDDLFSEEETDEPQYSKRDSEIVSKLKDSGFISQTHGDLFIKQHFYSQALNFINKLRKEFPEVGIAIERAKTKLGAKSQGIFKVKVDDQLGLQFSKENEYNYISEAAFREIADRLSEKTGVEYAVVSPKEALEILEKEHGLNISELGFTEGNAPAFYHKNKIVMPSNYLTAESAFHEFSHPFVHAIMKENKALFTNLKRQLQSSTEGNKIIDTVKKNYPELIEGHKLTDKGWEEAIVTSLGKMADNKLNETKDKGLISALKQMLKRLSEFLSKMFSKNGDVIKPFDLKATTTLQELASLLHTDTKIELAPTEEEETSFSKKTTIEDNLINPYSKQQEFLKNKIFQLERRVKSTKPGTEEHNKAIFELTYTRDRIDTATRRGEEHLYKDLGEEALQSVEDLIKDLSEGNVKDIADSITYAKNIIDAWKEFQDLRDIAGRLERELYPYISKLTVDKVNEYSTRKEPITQELIDSQKRDIGKFENWVGALADSDNIIASTIGAMITRAHNRISTKNKKINAEIQEEIDALVEYSKKNGVSVDKMYDVFIQEKNSTTVLTQQFLSDGSENPNWIKIQDTPELLRFHSFYRATMKEVQKAVPNFKGSGQNFIPNIKDRDLKDKVYALNPFKERGTTFTKGEENRADIVPLEMHKPIPASEKSNNLGQALSSFSMFANNYTEMSDILPEVRLLQEEVKYVRDTETGIISDRQFIKPSDPSVTISGKESNLNKMIQTVIDMQVKGEMKNEEWKPKYGAPIIDIEGNTVAEKYVDISGMIDNLLSYNSMLRIGMSPITAASNVIFGDISNVIEAVGGRFITARGLVQASNIFMKQTLDEDSVLNSLLERLNPLQEMDDYDYVEKIKSAGKKTKMSPERLKEYMYLPQKAGEKWLQSRTMLAVMIKDGLLTSSGEKTEKFNKLTDKELDQLSDKIQRLNQLIHGRYTSKEAAIAQQSVIYRVIAQFRKWIPAAIENRIGSKRWDNRLQVDIEGRYRTWGRLLGNLKDTSEKIKNSLSGKENGLTELEVYNIKKGLSEIVIWAALAVGYSALHGDDDKDKKFRKQAWVKTTLTLLSRSAGDIEFFYSPRSATKLTLNAAPLAKTVDDIAKVVISIPTALHMGDKWKVTKGRNKGKSKFAAQLPRIIPLANPIDQIISLASKDDLPNYQ